MNRFVTMIMSGALGLMMAGCASSRVNIKADAIPPGVDRSQAREVTGSAAGFQLFLLIPIKINNRIANAYQNLLDNAGDAYVTDIRMSESWKYAFVGTQYRTTFKATAYPKSGIRAPETETTATPPPGEAAAPPAPDDPLRQKLDALEKMRAEGAISEAEYERTKAQLTKP